MKQIESSDVGFSIEKQLISKNIKLFTSIVAPLITVITLFLVVTHWRNEMDYYLTLVIVAIFDAFNIYSALKNRTIKNPLGTFQTRREGFDTFRWSLNLIVDCFLLVALGLSPLSTFAIWALLTFGAMTEVYKTKNRIIVLIFALAGLSIFLVQLDVSTTDSIAGLACFSGLVLILHKIERWFVLEMKAFNAEYIEKFRLSQEVKDIKAAQTLFLPTTKSTQSTPSLFSCSWENKKYEIDFLYRPAQEVAGDWFSIYENELFNETVVVIVDISGHGTAAGLFTVVAGTIFEVEKDLCVRERRRFDARNYYYLLNSVLLKKGNHKWHASSSIVVINNESGTVSYYNAGHVPLITFATSSEDKEAEYSCNYLMRPSSLLGIEENPSIGTSTFHVKKGDGILLYTDGLNEQRSISDQRFGRRQLKRSTLTAALGNIDGQSVIDSIISDMDDFSDGHAQEDDIALVWIKCVS